MFAPWLKLYSADFLKSSDDFTFPEIKSYSDAPFHVKTILKASKISFVPEYLYYYRENDDSLVHSSSNTINFFKLSDIIGNYLNDNGFMDEFKEEFDAFKLVKLVYYMGFADSDEYDIDKRNIVLDSDNLKECKLALELYDCKRRVKSMQESKSWKVTKPLRKFTSSLK